MSRFRLSLTLLAALALGPLAVLAFGASPALADYAGEQTQGNTASSPLFVKPTVGSGEVTQANPLPIASVVPATMNWSASAPGWATITTLSGAAQTFDLTTGDYKFAVVFSTTAGTGQNMAFYESDGVSNNVAVPGRRVTDCRPFTGVGYAPDYFVVPILGRTFGLYFTTLSSGTATGTLYFTREDPTARLCPDVGHTITGVQVSVATSSPATLVVAARTGLVGTGRKSVVLKNTSATTYVSCNTTNAVATNSGFVLQAGDQSEPILYDGAIYCIAAGSAVNVSVREIY